ncbi:putative quinol monooxygenase [Jeotgalibacillus terrae]|uniref:Quinol monooxygenase n=1 Tax=Jeotgalibacillus terrae TaxID=587735 RepID=A0ABW5ZKB5_9BACL|nr:putative quinol monooxygenase [Jeotgalibacillus terrae]MBM7578072.1 quinol monooxygenase YgiN [Jeotgalibacillus terrae]
MSKFSLFGKFTVEEENRDLLTDILLEAAESMRDFEACEVYIVSVSESEADTVYVYETWRDEDAHQASLSLEATQRLISRAKPIITGMERIQSLKTLGGKGIQ